MLTGQAGKKRSKGISKIAKLQCTNKSYHSRVLVVMIVIVVIVVIVIFEVVAMEAEVVVQYITNNM